jgi:arginase
MPRPVCILGAPSSIGIKTYDDGTMRRLDLAPAALRDAGLVTRLDASDRGDVPPPAYREFTRPPLAMRNAADVLAYTHAVAGAVAAAAADGTFVLLLGGDCSIVLGALLGLRQRRRVGLAYLDAHSDFALAESSVTGSAAAMCLALAVGHGTGPIAHLRDDGPLIRGADTVLLGRRDHDQEAITGGDALAAYEILDIDQMSIVADGPSACAARALLRVSAESLDGFWIHLDADVLDPTVMPAVDSPVPGGLGLDAVAALLAPLVRHPKALGLQLTIYDPHLDPDAACAGRLVELLAHCLASENNP